MEPTLRALSLGAGVQSTTLALLAEAGDLPTPDVAIFADTGWEPAAVYTHLARLTAAVSFPVLRVSVGNLRDDALDPERRYASVPYFVRNPDGTDGMGRRQCTSEYKLNPIRRKVRELLGAAGPEFRTVPGGRVAEQWVGFSTDEVGRVNAGLRRGAVSDHPLSAAGVGHVPHRLPAVAAGPRLGGHHEECLPRVPISWERAVAGSAGHLRVWASPAGSLRPR
jgi:hypothetical protein